MVNAFTLSPALSGNTAGSESTESLSRSVSRVAALFPAERRAAAEAQYHQLLQRGDDSLAALESAAALRQLCNADSQSAVTVDYDDTTQDFTLSIDGQCISRHRDARLLEQLNLSETSLLAPQRLALFSDPLRFFCWLKELGSPHQTTALSAHVAPHDGSALILSANGHEALRLPLGQIDERAWAEAHRLFPTLAETRPAEEHRILDLRPPHAPVALPPPAPLRDDALDDLLPAPIALGSLLQMQRHTFNLLFRVKDMLVGGPTEPAYQALSRRIETLNHTLATLRTTLTTVRQQSETLLAPAEALGAEIAEEQRAQEAVRQALQAVLTECAGIEGGPEAPPVIQRIRAQALHVADRLAALEQRMDGVAQSESPTGERGVWRARLAQVSAQLGDGAGAVGDDDRLWLALVQQAQGEAGAPDATRLRQAVARVMQSGVSLPDTAVAQRLLAACYPYVASLREDTAALPAPDSLLIDRERYSQLGALRRTTLQERDRTLQLQQLLSDASQQAQETLRRDLDEIKGNPDYFSAFKQRSQALDALEDYFSRRWSPGVDTDDSDGAAAPIPHEPALEGLLYLCARSGPATVNRDRLLLDNDTFVAEDIAVSEAVLREYQRLAPAAQARVQTIAADCLQLEHQIDYHSEFHQNAGVNFPQALAQGTLRAQFMADPEGYLAFFQQRDRLLQRYQDSVAALASQLPDAEAPHGVLNRALTEINAERRVIAALLRSGETLAAVDRLGHTLAAQTATSARLAAEITTAAQPFDGALATINQQVYQLRSAALRAMTAETDGMVRQRDALRQGKESGSDVVSQLAQLEQRIASNSAAFRVALLALQQEQQRADGPGGGGYPKDIYWSSWLLAQMGDKVSSLLGARMDKPRDLLLQYQLALSGKGIVAASLELMQALRKLPTDPTQALTELGFTPSQLLAWASAYPQELAYLSSNLDHTYHALVATGSSTLLGDMFHTAWQRGTTASVIQDTLFGKREPVVGVTDAKPMPPALIMLLSMADWAPYAAGGVKGMLSQNLGGVVAGGLGGALFGGGVATVALTSILQFVVGAAQAQAEKGIADKVAEQRRTNVVVNAVLRGMQLDSSASINERIQRVTAYAMQREALRSAGTIGRDLAEEGKRGVIGRMLQDMSLTWKHASGAQRALLVAASVAAPLLIGGVTLGFLALGPLGLLPAGIIAIGAALFSGALTTGSLWNSMVSWLMPELGQRAQREMNGDILERALAKAREEAGIQMAKTLAQIDVRDRHTLDEIQRQGGQQLTHRLDTLAGELRKQTAFASLSPQEVGEQFDLALRQAASESAPHLPLNMKAEAIIQAGLSVQQAEEIRDEIEQALWQHSPLSGEGTAAAI
ncbi:type III secretion system effector EseJ [Edwardsiella anguillarum]|uniref:Type III secretion system effector EseJ n=1 Tax=Edwardsiella anguillarum TaxID=1821960 RepID=A0ABY8SGG6_9GAMM|nr:type III secretion system effector EseJ [Edwardsiella anguillarum]WHP84779.1 type III secretion system effector EseJ [Edwardsiella anguillarum]WHP88562.1 type III secretion system effector EseJ [Edwardsiella anguillarum]WHP92363.1 type III secretion system effector EseJ [Edwardsiella anguillarum]WHP96168.1 type III secretion system effector EseJ [Edwardsiella anguillarum]WHQ00036.1 type III secretion system effector EseJ [Edwardsiella anguillarum]